MKNAFKPVFGILLTIGLLSFGIPNSEAKSEKINIENIEVTMNTNLEVAADWYIAIGSGYAIVVKSDPKSEDKQKAK